VALPLIVVGLGVRGRQWAALVRGTPGWELAGAVEPDPAARAAASADLGLDGARCMADLEPALERWKPSAVIVATSIDRHVEPCRAALARGVGVLVEKPFALQLADARRLVDLAERAGAPLLVGQNYRYMRMPRTVRRLVAEGRLGPIAVAVGQMYRARPEQSRALERVQDSALWELAVHHLDFLRLALGQRAVAVQAQRAPVPWAPAAEGAAFQALIRFDGGTRASYTVSYATRGQEFFERGQEFYLRLSGERGTLHVFHRWLLWCPQGGWPRLVRRGPRDRPEEGVLLRQLARALHTGEPAEASGRDNLDTVALLEACARAATAGRVVDPRTLYDEPL
jgi:predicted dehydrogenase